MENDSHSCQKGFKNIFSMHLNGVITVITPILLLPIWLTNNDPANGCMYLMCVMAVYWITEALPLAVTSMLPILAFPVMGIMTTEEACRLYFKDTLIMFFTNLMVASSIEYSMLHVRLGLKVLQLVGCSPRKLHFGICMASMFMSIWISNTACTAMMCPIIFAVLDELSEQGIVRQYLEDDADLPKSERRPSKLGCCFFLSVAYASTIGGLGSLIGTPTNLTFKGIYESRFPNSEEKINFGTYMAYSIPMVIVANILMYACMEITFMGLFRPSSPEAKELDIGKEGELIGKKVIDEKYDALGPLTIHEISVGLLFIFLILLYVFRKPGFIEGWVDLFEQKSIKNSVPTIFVLLLLYMLPGNYKFLKFWDESSLEKTPALLSWKFMASKVPWGLVFLVGGGTVLAHGSKVSGMATKLGKALSVLDFLPPYILLLVMMTAACILTNFSANIAICNIIMPVLAEMAVVMKIHPLYLVFPVGLAVSLAFMLPVGTPPNALIQGIANIETKTMILGGVLPSITSVLSFWIMSLTYGKLIYTNLGEYPAWADDIANGSRSDFELNLFD